MIEPSAATPSHTNASSPPAAATADDEAFWTRAHLAEFAPPRARQGRAIGHLVVIWGAAGALGVLFLFSRFVASVLGLPFAAIVIMWSLVALAALIFGLRLFARRLRNNFWGMPPAGLRTDERYRVRAIAPEQRLNALRALGPIDDMPFEPQEFTGFLVLPMRPPMLVLWVLLSILVGAALYVLPMTQRGPMFIFVCYGAFAAGGLAVALIWPTTIRVVPGRVDIVRRLVFRPERAERRTLTLRTSRVEVDLRRWYAHIQGPTPETSIDLWLLPVRGRIELAHALLLGAVSTYQPGPLPDEPILGRV